VGAFALPALGAAQERPHDFLFRTPRASLSLRFGYAVPNVSGDVFDFTLDSLTTSRSDFNSVTVGGELAFRLTPRTDLALNVGYSRSQAPSEYVNWVDNNDLPIQQSTEFRRIPVTAGLKYYFRDRGRALGRFAWVPAPWAPYVGAGAGWVWYRFEQSGDFVDFTSFDVYPDTYRSEGKAPTLHVFGGADWTLSPTFVLTAEARYAWAKADMGQDFVNPGGPAVKIGLSGLQATAGISVRF
jgi:hypothetical protein